ncbi:MAG: hypothetical protein JXR59_11570 [Desulfuromonadaceae bacterium]|nr:hypothetical protein [Desulfuromonadaceae bacterium]
MAFNSGQTFKDMLEAAAMAADDDWNLIETAMTQLMESERETLREVAVEWIRSGISDKALDGQLENLQKRYCDYLCAQDSDLDDGLCRKTVQAALSRFWEALMEAL